MYGKYKDYSKTVKVQTTTADMTKAIIKYTILY